MSRVQRFGTICVLMLAFLLSGNIYAADKTNDPHELYEQRCAACHESHAGEFVNEHLWIVENRVIGRQTGRELGVFLRNGHGKLNPDEMNLLVLQLISILNRGGIFRDKCHICHDRAVLLARRQLVLRDGKLIARYSARDMAMFLEYHGRLEGAEVDAILQMLSSQLRTEPGPSN